MAPWLSLTVHVVVLAGGVAAGSWTLRRTSDALLRLVAGLVAILARDKRSRAARALEVLRATQEARRISPDRLTLKRQQRQLSAANRTDRYRPHPAERKLLICINDSRSAIMHLDGKEKAFEI